MSDPRTARYLRPVRILVVSALYPPVVSGGYEVECSVVVERLREHHSVLVLSSDQDRARAGEQADVRRELARLTPDGWGSLRAPLASLRAAESARRALRWEPDLIYVWNGASIPQASLRVLADSGVPLAFRVCEHWFGGLFTGDQYMRELLPARRGPARAAWAAGCRALNLLPALRLGPTAPLRAAISWNSEAMRRTVQVPSFVEPVLERIDHPVPPHGELYAGVVRDPAPEPEIVFLGRVTPYKGVAVAIEALALLRSEHGIPARLVVLGPEDPGHGADMRRLAERLGIAGAVSWRGQATPDEAAAAFARAHALIVPSTWEEPFGMVTIEGAFARVPIVASDVGGISEGVHDEEHALLFGRGDAAAAAAALARTLEDPEQTAARVQRAFARVQAFKLEPYLERQERFVLDAHAALISAERPERPAKLRR
jgi:glycosyltransferase involved in cell wall biosynthesis